MFVPLPLVDLICRLMNLCLCLCSWYSADENVWLRLCVYRRFVCYCGYETVVVMKCGVLGILWWFCDGNMVVEGGCLVMVIWWLKVAFLWWF